MKKENQESHNEITYNKKKEQKKHKTKNKNEKKTEKDQKETLINSDLDQIKKQLLELQNREKDILLRAKAEVENNIRRTKIEIEKSRKFALEHFINELLPVIDNLERTISTIEKNKHEFLSILEGIQLTLKSFLKIIKKYGVETIEIKNVPFNPKIHQAVTTIHTEHEKENQIVEIIQKGYMLNGRLLRPAMVIVSKQKENKTKE